MLKFLSISFLYLNIVLINFLIGNSIMQLKKKQTINIIKKLPIEIIKNVGKLNFILRINAQKEKYPKILYKQVIVNPVLLTAVFNLNLSIFFKNPFFSKVIRIKVIKKNNIRKICLSNKK